jgi:hypothetical protein
MPDGERNLPNIDYDREKVEETVLALLWLTLDGHRRAWKSHDWVCWIGCTGAVTSQTRRATPSRCC